MITAELLKQIPLFSGLPDNERASLAARAADVRLQTNEWLVVEGQAPSFFAVLEGHIAVSKSLAGHEQQIAAVEKILSELGLARNQIRRGNPGLCD